MTDWDPRSDPAGPSKPQAPAASGGYPGVNRDGLPEAPPADAPAFMPADGFQGKRPGYVFKTGTQGTGYYLDGIEAKMTTNVAKAPPAKKEEPIDPHERRKQLQETSLVKRTEASGRQAAEAEAADDKPPLDDAQRKEITAEVKKLKAAKAKAVEEEEFEEAAALKRRIKVLEDTLGEQVEYEAKKVAIKKEEKAKKKEVESIIPKKKLNSQLEHGEDILKVPSENMKLIAEERDFLEKSAKAQLRKGVTDDLVNGVPTWAYKDAFKGGSAAVKTERPSELQYVFKGMIEDEKWEEGANFQVSFTVQMPPDVAFTRACATSEDSPNQIQIGPGAHILYHASGTAQLTELLGAEIVENQTVVFRIVVAKPKVKGKVKLEAAKTVTTREPFQKQPFYSFKSIWRLRPNPAGGTHVTRIVSEFKQFELLDFDALKAVCRSIELENEGIRQTWSSSLAMMPDKKLAVRGGGPGTKKAAEEGAVLAKKMEADGEMYSSSFVVEAAVDRVYNSIVSHLILSDYDRFVCDGSFVQLDATRHLLRRTDGTVLLVTSRAKEDQRQWTTMTVGHKAGTSFQDTQDIRTDKQVMQDPFYRVINEWTFTEHDEEQTLVKRKMKDFKQTGNFDVVHLAQSITEEADEQNRSMVAFFRKQRNQEGKSTSKIPQSISVRANYAMRSMPEILDMAAKNNVMEVREMLEVKGADPNYIHVRTDSWAVSDSRMEFFEEITPLVVAAEHGACEVIKILFNHPQIDVNLCCCAFNDMEIYNYYTAYDMTISRKHPHAAALMRARGVLPAANEHVFKPPFDRIHARPLRETLHNAYGDEDSWGEGEMPAWDTIAEGNPRLASYLHQVADTLNMTRCQKMDQRQKIFKGLQTEWHPDRHANAGGKEMENATKVFQWLQVVKDWYLEANEGPEIEQQQLEGPENPEQPEKAPANAQQVVHPSGSAFFVW